MCRELTGISQDAIVSYGKTFFKEGMLFTHRGLSGPSILQISSYWKLTNEININLCPDLMYLNT
jgi:predicted flavoprotein YhiN